MKSDVLTEISVETELFRSDAVTPPRTVCFVSDGDICRGPMCAAVYNKLCQNGDIKAVSCGINAADGEPIFGDAYDALVNGGWISGNERISASRLTDCHIDCCERLIAVDGKVAMNLLLTYPEAASKLTCLGREILPASTERRAAEVLKEIVEAMKVMTGNG